MVRPLVTPQIEGIFAIWSDGAQVKCTLVPFLLKSMDTAADFYGKRHGVADLKILLLRFEIRDHFIDQRYHYVEKYILYDLSTFRLNNEALINMSNIDWLYFYVYILILLYLFDHKTLSALLKHADMYILMYNLVCLFVNCFLNLILKQVTVFDRLFVTTILNSYLFQVNAYIHTILC